MGWGLKPITGSTAEITFTSDLAPVPATVAVAGNEVNNGGQSKAHGLQSRSNNLRPCGGSLKAEDARPSVVVVTWRALSRQEWQNLYRRLGEHKGGGPA